MPAPGPLIGSDTKRRVAEAAILADMEHRGFTSYGDGLFKETVMKGAGESYDAWQVEIRDGSVVVDQIMSAGSTPPGEAPKPADYAHLQTDVFVHWRSEIDDVFRYWEDFPESEGLRYDVQAVLSGASEIRLRSSIDADSGSFVPGNSRLASDIANLMGRAGELNGNYAQAFHDAYLTKLQPNIDALHALTMVLAYALGGERELFQRTRQQVADIADEAEAAMLASAPQTGKDGSALEVALIVVGSVAAGVAAIPSGGTSVAATAAMIASFASTGASTASSLLSALETSPAEPEALRLGAGTPQGVLDKIRAALDEVDARIVAEEETLDELLSATTAATNGPGVFNIAPPAVIDHTGTSVLDPEQDLIVDSTIIGSITELWIPTINGDLTACAAALDTSNLGWNRPIIIGLGPSGPWPSYSALQAHVAALLADTAGELSRAGDSLQAAAAIIGLSDETTNAEFARQAEQINTEDVDY